MNIDFKGLVTRESESGFSSSIEDCPMELRQQIWSRLANEYL